jgi:hypothetical protein
MIRNATFAVLLMLPVGSAEVNAQGSLDARAQSEVIDSLAARLQREYVFPDVAARMISALKEAERAGRYRSIVQTGAFADSLTAHLQAAFSSHRSSAAPAHASAAVRQSTAANHAHV